MLSKVGSNLLATFKSISNKNTTCDQISTQLVYGIKSNAQKERLINSAHGSCQKRDFMTIITEHPHREYRMSGEKTKYWKVLRSLVL